MRSILFVDDEPNILSSLERLFSCLDYKTFYSDNPHDALELLRREEVSVMVSDNRMPGMTGIELMSKARSISPDTVKILMTAHADMETAIEAINVCEVFRFVTKPWNNDELVSIVEEGVNRYNLIQSMRNPEEANLLSIAQTIELKDPYTKGHCDRVAGYALTLADSLGLSVQQKTDIRHGCWLHDCGKIGIPESILNKPGKLTDEEMDIIRKHPDWGAEVARIANKSTIIVNIIRFHHEAYNGTGYPTGIHGEDIPLEARIVTVADVFDALTSTRPYRKAYGLEEALNVMEGMRGKTFDPVLFDIFLKSPAAMPAIETAIKDI